ncbi:MAG: major outer membrane protein [Aliarcobacter sp.]|nr:major outer membrane protein [Aliarcobacter sp.]
MKITKLSLATIIALGSISCANAQSLEDAIKNVEVSGTVAYRYNDYEENNSTQKDDSATSNNYKVAINLRSKVNDDVKFNSRFIAGNKTNAGEVGLDTQADSDSNLDVFLSEANFDYTGVQNSVFTIGKQGVTSPFTLSRDALGNEATGTGLVATTHLADMLSLTGGYFNQTNFNNNDGGLGTITGSEDFVYVTGTLAYAGMTLDATYGELENIFDAYTVGLTGNYTIDQLKLNPYARYSSLDLDSTDNKNTLWKTGIQANLGIFGAYIAYGETNEEGGTVGTDASSDTGMDDHWRVTLSGISDASAIYASVDTQVTDKINVALKYSGIDAGSNSNATDHNEIYVQTAYKMSNNLSTYIRLGQLEVDQFYADGSDLKSTIGRAHIQYSF